MTFEQVGCPSGHGSSLIIDVDDPIFSESSQHASHRNAIFPADQDPITKGVNPNNPVMFDLTANQPDNVLSLSAFVSVSLSHLEGEQKHF